MANYVIEKSTDFNENAPIRAADNGVPIYWQYDTRWGSHPYDKQPGNICKPPTPTVCSCNDNSTILTSGCGVVAMTMAINFWAKKQKCNATRPEAVADFFMTHGGRVCGSGSAYANINKEMFKNTFGIVIELVASDTQLMTSLQKNYPCIISGKNYTGLNYNGDVLTNKYTGGHFVCLTNIDSQNRIRVNDSGNSPTSGRAITAFQVGKLPNQATTVHQRAILYPVGVASPLL
jgi:hypothetical protein